MVEIKKDKNLVYISDDGKTYIVNINSGIIINDKTKREVSRLPFAKKNYIENILKNNGFAVYDTDEMAHEILDKIKACKKRVSVFRHQREN